MLKATLIFILITCSFCSPLASSQSVGHISSRLLAESKLIEQYSVVLDLTHPILELGAIKAPFNVTESQMKEVIATNGSNLPPTGIYNSSETEQFFQLTIGVSERTKPHYTLTVRTLQGVGIRIVEELEALWDHASAKPESYNYTIVKEYSHEENLWVQFFCENDGFYPITFGIVPHSDSAFASFSEVASSKNFTILKTCQKGFRRDFLLTPMDIYKTPLRADPYHLLEILGHELVNQTNITMTYARTFIEIKVIGPPQVIVQPQLKSEDEKLDVALLGDGMKGGIATDTNSLEFIFALDCYEKNGSQSDIDHRLFTFSFFPPPFDKVEIPIWVDCKTFSKGITYYPFNVETIRGKKDVIYGGATTKSYKSIPNATTHQVVVIPPEVGATEFYIYLEASTQRPDTKTGDMAEFEFDWFASVNAHTDNDILTTEIVNVPSKGMIVTKEAIKMVVIYNCRRSGKANVTVSFLQHDHGYDFTVIKHCPNKIKPGTNHSFLKFLFASGVIAFGCFLVTILRALIHKEHSASDNSQKSLSNKKRIETEMSLPTEASRVSHFEDNI